jgi:hypothetical protein
VTELSHVAQKVLDKADHVLDWECTHTLSLALAEAFRVIADCYEAPSPVREQLLSIADELETIND